jgi:hypothetical protein
LTHPLREPKTSRTRQSKKQSEQIDPDELRRKLEAHLAEQKKQVEERRARARAKKEKESAYHHVPTVAAAAFERTTTPVFIGEKEKRRKYVHKLAQLALKRHAEETIRPTTSSFELRKTQAMDHARKQRDLIGDRNQFQRTRHLEDAAQFDKQRNLNKVPQRTFRADHLDLNQTAHSCRPLSTGDLNWEEDFEGSGPIFHTKPKAKALLIQTANDRQDWEQRDEVPVEVHRSVKERVSPFLRKTDSMWMLKSKKQPKADVLPETGHPASNGGTKSKKSTFLGLFNKR